MTKYRFQTPNPIIWLGDFWARIYFEKPFEIYDEASCCEPDKCGVDHSPANPQLALCLKPFDITFRLDYEDACLRITILNTTVEFGYLREGSRIR